jgi:hypothetical protein
VGATPRNRYLQIMKMEKHKRRGVAAKLQANTRQTPRRLHHLIPKQKIINKFINAG